MSAASCTVDLPAEGCRGPGPFRDDDVTVHRRKETIVARARSLVSTLLGWFPVVVAVLVGVLVGLAVFTFGYAGGASYFGHESETCNQCHAMNKQYDA